MTRKTTNGHEYTQIRKMKINNSFNESNSLAREATFITTL